MTQPETLPLANDAERMDILRGELADLLEEARKLFKYPEERRLTILVRQPGEPERDCVVTDDTPEGVNEIVSRRLRFPDKPEAEAACPHRTPVWLSVVDRVNLGWCQDCGAVANFIGDATGWVSPAVALPSDKLRRLVRKWRAEADKLGTLPDVGYQILSGNIAKFCDELEALLSQEPSSGEAQKPACWAIYYCGGPVSYYETEEQAKRSKADRDAVHNDAELRSIVPLFASPVTDRGKK